jgi:hypothetical protein
MSEREREISRGRERVKKTKCTNLNKTVELHNKLIFGTYNAVDSCSSTGRIESIGYVSVSATVPVWESY